LTGDRQSLALDSRQWSRQELYAKGGRKSGTATAATDSSRRTDKQTKRAIACASIHASVSNDGCAASHDSVSNGLYATAWQQTTSTPAKSQIGNLARVCNIEISAVGNARDQARA
jgi:hypothetical protein